MIKSRVYNGEDSVELRYNASKMILLGLMALVLIPLKGISEQDRLLHNDTKAKLKCY